MATSGDGVLTANFDPARNLVSLVTDGSAWPGPTYPDHVTLTRTVAGSETPVRGAESVAAGGGTLVWSDNEAPLDVEVTYTAYSFIGSFLEGTSVVTISTTGAAWGVWVKVPGRPELTARAPLAYLGDFATSTLGGSWQVPGGSALAQSAGMGALATTMTLLPVDTGSLGAVERAVRQAPGQVVLIQTGAPEELPSGYYQVGQMVRQNPAQVLSDVYARRRLLLSLVATVAPAGPASGWSGVSYADLAAQYATYQDLADADLTYLDVSLGAWS